jgi:hypothetical protein
MDKVLKKKFDKIHENEKMCVIFCGIYIFSLQFISAFIFILLLNFCSESLKIYEENNKLDEPTFKLFFIRYFYI